MDTPSTNPITLYSSLQEWNIVDIDDRSFKIDGHLIYEDDIQSGAIEFKNDFIEVQFRVMASDELHTQCRFVDLSRKEKAHLRTLQKALSPRRAQASKRTENSRSNQKLATHPSVEPASSQPTSTTNVQAKLDTAVQAAPRETAVQPAPTPQALTASVSPRPSIPPTSTQTATFESPTAATTSQPRPIPRRSTGGNLLKYAVVLLIGAGLGAYLTSLLTPMPEPIGEKKVEAIETVAEKQEAEQFQINSHLTGLVSELLVDQGDVVNKDDAILRMSNQELKLKLQTHRLEIESSRSKIETLKKQLLSHREHVRLEVEKLTMELALAQDELGEAIKVRAAAESAVETLKPYVQEGAISQRELDEAVNEFVAAKSSCNQCQGRIEQLEFSLHATKSNRILGENGTGDKIGELEAAIEIQKTQLLHEEKMAEITETKLRNLVITAPQNGRISKMHVRNGQFLQIADPILDLELTKPKAKTAKAPETELAK